MSRPDLVKRAVKADIAYWRLMHYRCPTCGLLLGNLNRDESLYPHMVGECDLGEILVGPNWVRRGVTPNSPLADATERRQESRTAFTGKAILRWGLIFLTASMFTAWRIFR
jgi:hypothetical protein